MRHGVWMSEDVKQGWTVAVAIADHRRKVGGDDVIC